jgi:hypothetical protein
MKGNLAKLGAFILLVMAGASITPAQDSVSFTNVSTVRVRGRSSVPSLSTAGNAVFYFDKTDGKLKVSEDGGAFEDMAGGGAGAPYPDTTVIVTGSADDTKQLRFELDGFTAGQTRVLTPPDSNGVLAVLGLAQTWTAAQTYGDTLTVALGTITDAKQALSITATWNDGSEAFAAPLKVDVTDTASASGSLLADYQVGDNSLFAIRKDGHLLLRKTSNADWRVFNNGSNRMIFHTTFDRFLLDGNAGGAVVGRAGFFAWSSQEFDLTAAPDLVLKRPVAGVLEMEGASNAGATFSAAATSPAQIGANQNDYNPGATSFFQRWSTDASRNVTGLTFTAAQVDGQTHLIWNVGSNDIVLANESASSTAANRFLTSTGADLTVGANKVVLVQYDGTASRWRATLLP